MTRLSRVAVLSLVVGLVLAAFTLPWIFSTIKESSELLKTQRAYVEQTPVPPPDAAAVAAARAKAEALTARRKAAAEQSARISAEVATFAIPQPTRPVPTPEPSRPAYSIVPTGTPELVPLQGWVDQPNKSRPGHVRTELMIQFSSDAVANKQVQGRTPCFRSVRRPAERLQLPYGWVDVPARTMYVPCGS